MIYYFNINNQNVGPLDSDAIKEYISTAKINLHTLTWTEGMENWQKVSTVSELVSNFPELKGIATPPPLPHQPDATSQLDKTSNSVEIKHENLASFGERFAAGLIDIVILIIPTVIIDTFMPIIGGPLIQLAYYSYFMSDVGGGQSLGYKAMKLKLVDQSNSNLVPLSTILIWFLIYAFLGFISWIWFFTDKNQRMLHNIISKTVVKKIA